MRSKRTILASSLIWAITAIALRSTHLSAGKPAPKNPTTADLYAVPTTSACPDLPTEVTGIYQDGKGTYLPNEKVEWASNGDLRITPLCSANRQLNVLLPAAAMALLSGSMELCRGGTLLKIPALLNAQTGVVGQPSLPPDYPKAASVYFYFLVDTNRDGNFSLRNDDAYNLVWQSGIHLTRTEYFDRTTYELTTDLTSPNAELLRGAGNGGESKGVFCMPLRLTATRMK